MEDKTDRVGLPERADSESGAPVPRKRGKRAWLIVGVVVMVVVVAAGGFLVWHEQPGFCNAVCHDPMDNYVNGYYHDTGLLANTHERAGVTCLECHEADLGQQVAEGAKWAAGDFVIDDAGNLVTQNVTADQEMCATGECHDLGEVVATTQEWGGEKGVNPHLSHQGEGIDCGNCHDMHGSSFMYCNTCHDYQVPEGWKNPR